MLLLGGFAVAAAMSKFHIAKAMATVVLSRAGTRPSAVLLANMLVATVASMWISNVAAPVLCFSLIQVRFCCLAISVYLCVYVSRDGVICFHWLTDPFLVCILLCLLYMRVHLADSSHVTSWLVVCKVSHSRHCPGLERRWNGLAYQFAPEYHCH